MKKACIIILSAIFTIFNFLIASARTPESPQSNGSLQQTTAYYQCYNKEVKAVPIRVKFERNWYGSSIKLAEVYAYNAAAGRRMWTTAISGTVRECDEQGPNGNHYFYKALVTASSIGDMSAGGTGGQVWIYFNL